MGGYGTVSLAAEATRRLGLLLFEPSATVTDVVERRRARLLAKLEAVLTLENVAGAIVVRQMGDAHHQHLPSTFLVGSVASFACYLASRGRYPRAAIWSNVLITLSTSLFVGVTAVSATGNDVLMNLIMMLPAVLLVSTMASPRATVATGAGRCWSLRSSIRPVNNAAWQLPFRQGLFFLSVHVAFIVVFSVHRGNVEADRAAELRTRNEELEALRSTLEQRVVERTALLSRRNSELRLVLDGILDGIVMVDRSGEMANEHSAVLAQCFGAPEPKQHLSHYFSRLTPEFARQLELGWAQVVDHVLPLEVALQQLPRAFVFAGRHYRISYESAAAGTTGQILLVVSDVSNEVQRERSQRERQESMAVFGHAVEDRRALLGFLDEGSALVSLALERRTEASARHRALHTLKGNALLFGMSSVAEQCHLSESALSAVWNAKKSRGDGRKSPAKSSRFWAPIAA